MRAEVIALGDELTSGQRLDTNSQWISQQLEDLGIRVLYHTTVGDELAPEVEAFRNAVQRVDVVIATGGLGPTADDLTRDALAVVGNAELVLDEPSLRHIENLFAQRRGRAMPERNRVQAMFPQGSRPIPNPHGTAPGIEMEIAISANQRVSIFALPGVPAEMKEMWFQTVVPRLQALLGKPRRIHHHTIKCFGVGESDLEQRLPDLIRRGRMPIVGITVSQATISLRITAEGMNDEECRQLIEPTRQTIFQCLGDLVFGEGEEEELQHAVLRLLHQRDLTLAVCDWGTAGLVARWLAELSALFPGRFRGAWVISDAASAATMAQTEVGDQLEAEKQNVMALAERCRLACGADLALAIGAWPAVASSEPSGHIHFGLASRDATIHRSTSTAGHPDLLQTRAAKQALDFVRKWLLRGVE